MVWPQNWEGEFFGNVDAWQLLCKATIGDMAKSTKVYEIKDVGCLVQVTTKHGDHCAEALQFVPGVKLANDENGNLVLEKDANGIWAAIR